MNLDFDFIRAQYPVFTNPDTARWAMFENAGGCYVPRQVSDRLHDFFQYTKVQPYGPFEASIKAGEAMEAGYRAMAGLLNCDPSELTLGPSTTMNFYVLAQAIRPLLVPGDEIIVTNQDHEANIGCWRRLSEFGAVIKEWRIDPQTGELAVEDLKSLVGNRTRLVCFTLCSNIVGTMNDFKTVCDIAHDAGALAIGDGVSFAPHRVLDVSASGLDLYLFSTYKTFGTHVGVMWGKQSVLDTLEPQGHYFNRNLPHYRFNPAGPLHAEIAALAGIEDIYRCALRPPFQSSGAWFSRQSRQGFRPFRQTRDSPGQSDFRSDSCHSRRPNHRAEAGRRRFAGRDHRLYPGRDALQRCRQTPGGEGYRCAQRTLLCVALPRGVGYRRYGRRDYPDQSGALQYVPRSGSVDGGVKAIAAIVPFIEMT